MIESAHWRDVNEPQDFFPLFQLRLDFIEPDKV